MDSKYNAITNNQQQQFNPFNFKRKLSNGNYNSSNDHGAKHFKSNNSPGIEFTKGNSTNPRPNLNGKGLSIDEQRHQLPVYKVRKQ